MVKGRQANLTVEIVEDPVYNERGRAGDEQFDRNAAWLEVHWSDLLPEARGSFAAVADQQAYVAATIEEAWAWARANHPEDEAPLVQYVPKDTRPRIYAHKG